VVGEEDSEVEDFLVVDSQEDSEVVVSGALQEVSVQDLLDPVDVLSDVRVQHAPSHALQPDHTVTPIIGPGLIIGDTTVVTIVRGIGECGIIRDFGAITTDPGITHQCILVVV
jgi:hypothetical protein